MRSSGSHRQISKLPLCRGDNFSSGTSSRSTELIHGGVRYLQKAITKLDYKQVNASFFLRSWHLSAEFLVPLVILLYLPSHVHFSFTGEAVTCLPSMTACPGIFWSCFKEILQLSRPLPASYSELIHEIIPSVMAGMTPMCPPLSANCLRRVAKVQSEMSPFSVTFHRIWEISLFWACVFFRSLILLSVGTCQGPGGEQQKEPN